MIRPGSHFHAIPLAAVAATLAFAAACGGDDSSPPRNARVEAGLQQTLDAAVSTPASACSGRCA
jgi:hypothetical protein